VVYVKNEQTVWNDVDYGRLRESPEFVEPKKEMLKSKLLQFKL
jgi:hypothetical protein